MQYICWCSFVYGGYVSILIAPVFAMGDVGDIGRRAGMFITISSMGVLIGPPISGAINARTGGYTDVGYYAGMSLVTHFFCRSAAVSPPVLISLGLTRDDDLGGVMVLSTFLLVIVRYLQLGHLFGKV